MSSIRVRLKPGKEKPLKAFHPWIFSGAIDEIDDSYQPGSLVKIYSSHNDFLGTGYINPASQIAIRMLTFETEEIDVNFFVKRFNAAKSLRNNLLSSNTNACRQIHGEGDCLPGLTLDQYGDFLALQFTTLGMNHLRELILNALEQVYSFKGIYEREDEIAGDIEEFKIMPGVVRGEEPPELVEIKENGYRFYVDIKTGQKTGFFLDQRENRKLIELFCKDKRVLNCFSYTGGFSIYAAKAGAKSITSVDIQDKAMELARKNFELNDLKGGSYQFVKADVFDFLREDNNQYDLIILDPPAFCKQKKHLEKACRGYKDINLFAMKKLLPRGLLFTSSCSHYISPDLFQKIIFGAAKDAGVKAQIITKTSHAFDHPINIYHPEGEYLKGLLLRISE